MSVSNPATAGLADEKLPELATLLAPGIPEPIEEAMARCGVKVISAEAIQVTYRPARRITVRYKAELIGRGFEGSHQLVAIGGQVPDGVAVLEDESSRIGIWRVPHDPFLPGMAAALHPEAAAGLLSDLGLAGSGGSSRLVAYRPGKRAVVHVTSNRGSAPAGSVFVKLVPTHQIGTLHEEHRRLGRLLPIPPSLGVSHDLGLVVLTALPGVTLREALLRDSDVPDPEAVLALSSALPPPAHGPGRGESPIQRATSVAAMLSLLLPDRRSQIDDLVGLIGPERRPATVPVHGDFYEAQIMVDGPRVIGMLDIDTYGWGRPADDPATLLGHLSVLDHSKPTGGVRTFASNLLRHCDRALDPVDLRLRVAAVVLGLATGPFRVQRGNWPEMTRARLDLAARWCASAVRIAGLQQPEDERKLIVFSEPSHVAATS